MLKPGLAFVYLLAHKRALLALVSRDMPGPAQRARNIVGWGTIECTQRIGGLAVIGWGGAGPGAMATTQPGTAEFTVPRRRMLHHP